MTGWSMKRAAKLLLFTSRTLKVECFPFCRLLFLWVMMVESERYHNHVNNSDEGGNDKDDGDCCDIDSDTDDYES